ncbi:gamma-glutamyltransferase [Sandarakinorhabdus sp.]|uniref:gamma-glutamyltransferase n=1 Tax=Sandarakinorhabdus sp. TaxID=1916663 RepID=UPI00286DD8E4|nr:gamma-glutamyltransferase [Sandarakinorhabdus sp.]
MSKTIFTAALFAVLVAGAAQAQPAPIPTDAPADTGTARTIGAGPFKAVVSAAHPLASDAGLEILRKGGSAADAIAATMLALTVVEPQSSGIGGGGFLVYQPARGKIASIDGREKAPGIASPRQFLGADGKPMPFRMAQIGGRSAGVPGNIRLIAQAHKKYGKLPWADLFAPAIRLADQGFAVTPNMARFIAYGQDPLKKAGPEGRALYFDTAGQPLKAGAWFRNPALAQTLRTIADKGPDAFYTGEIAASIVKAVSTADANPTAMTLGDVAAYRAKWRTPVCGQYRVWRVCGMGPPSSGGVGMLAMLKQLERYDMAGLGKDNAVAWHLFAESQRLAYADRDKWLGDADFVRVPVKGLTDARYLAARSALIRPDARLAKAEAGMPAGAPPRQAANDNEVAGTTHFAVADAAGNVATYTSTVESTFGSGLVAGGFVLNNELTDFNFDPNDQGVLTANRVQPGKRPRSSMSPTIVYDASGKAVLAIGAAGGSTIIAQVAKTIIGVLDWGLPVDEAIALPTMVAIGDGGVRVEKDTFLAAMQPQLAAMGHNVILIPPFGKLNGIERTPAGWRGGADPRSEGTVVGE